MQHQEHNTCSNMRMGRAGAVLMVILEVHRQSAAPIHRLSVSIY